jgi:hypothetical protein
MPSICGGEYRGLNFDGCRLLQIPVSMAVEKERVALGQHVILG